MARRPVSSYIGWRRKAFKAARGLDESVQRSTIEFKKLVDYGQSGDADGAVLDLAQRDWAITAVTLLAALAVVMLDSEITEADEKALVKRSARDFTFGEVADIWNTAISSAGLISADHISRAYDHLEAIPSDSWESLERHDYRMMLRQSLLGGVGGMRGRYKEPWQIEFMDRLEEIAGQHLETMCGEPGCPHCVPLTKRPLERDHSKFISAMPQYEARTVPPEGLDARISADSELDPFERFAGGAEIEVLERLGDWACVLSHIGNYSVWVEARRLN